MQFAALHMALEVDSNGHAVLIVGRTEQLSLRIEMDTVQQLVSAIGPVGAGRLLFRYDPVKFKI